MKHRVLVVATSPRSRGGISTVVKAFRETKVWEDFECYWIETHIDKGKLNKILIFFKAILDYLLHLPKYDIVHIHVSTKGSLRRKYIFFKFARFYKKKIIIHLHCGSQLSEIWNAKYEEIFTRADVCIVLSQSIKEMIVNRIGRHDKIKVLFNPCPIVLKRSADITRKKEILFAATLYKEKGYLDLIDAFAKIHKNHPEWKLLIAGNGNQEVGLKRVEQLELLDKIIFLGWIQGEEKDAIFRSSSIFCLPSYAEGFPMAILDAWAYGLPVITTPVGGIPDVVINEKNGLLVQPGDVNTLASKLNELMESESLRENLRNESIHLASSIFSVKFISQQLEDIYVSI